MIDKLPYELSTGVTATQEGLVMHQNDSRSAHFHGMFHGDSGWLTQWPDAAKRLRYREGEPWCYYDERSDGLICGTSIPGYHGAPSYLHRLAAILCDNAKAFQVLHWCVTNLGGES